MTHYIEVELKKKAEGTTSEILYTQWCYDKKLIPTALESISSLFPHYSLHNESHSISILNYIVRILGAENIQKLTAIDLWMLLMAAYYHDIGMVVSGTELQATVSDSKFHTFLEEVKADASDDLHENAQAFSIVNKRIEYSNSSFEYSHYEGFKLLLAAYFRNKHADRSKDIINNPQSILLGSPRIIIPPRIFKLLGDVCSCHTKDFEDVMRFPKVAVGIDTDDVHPLFIACMLRLGDLLDLDNGRFSEVMLSTLSKIPNDTSVHYDKHMSIEHYRADTERVEIKAFCKHPKVAEELQKWFAYINKEFGNQFKRWNDIVPPQVKGYLPTVGDLNVVLENYEPIDGKMKPEFKIDTLKALELLQGANIYSGDEQCMREVIQNAIDATLIRMWLDDPNPDSFTSPNDEGYKLKLKEYKLEVHIDFDKKDDTYKYWKITVKDQGIGISKHDLGFLINTASSSRNAKKKKIVDAMPQWMRPAGAFGIGFQSIFILTDKVTIKTKNYFDERAYEIELFKPNSKNKGEVLIKPIESNHSMNVGSELSFIYKTELNQHGVSIRMGSKTHSRASNFNPFTDDSLDYKIWKLEDEVSEILRHVAIPFEFTVLSEKLSNSRTEDIFKHFNKESSIAFTIEEKISNYSTRADIYYRGQKLDTTRQRVELIYFKVKINILGENAKDILSLNRNELEDSFAEKLYIRTIELLFQTFTVEFEKYTPEKKQFVSMFLEYYHNHDEMKSIDISKYEHYWKTFNLNNFGADITIGDLLANSNSIVVESWHNHLDRVDENIKYDQDITTFQLNNDYTQNVEFRFIFSLINRTFNAISFEIDSSNKKHITKYTKSTSPFNRNYCQVDDYDISAFIRSNKRNDYRFFSIPCVEKYSKLLLEKGKTYLKNAYAITFTDLIWMPIPYMMPPYNLKIAEDSSKNEFIETDLDTLANWLDKNRADESVTLDEIKELYKEFMREYPLDVINGLNQKTENQ